LAFGHFQAADEVGLLENDFAGWADALVADVRAARFVQHVEMDGVIFDGAVDFDGDKDEPKGNDSASKGSGHEGKAITPRRYAAIDDAGIGRKAQVGACDDTPRGLRLGLKTSGTLELGARKGPGLLLFDSLRSPDSTDEH
jgi:hypothetical protein